ncbi:hypothetical protein RB597_009420 [Gaeumannomyces tritici]
MLRSVHPQTLFHFVLTNQVAWEALDHDDNKKFVSETNDGQPGLEIGFHVPIKPDSRVITRLGRNADLILRHSTPQKVMSRVYVAFEFHPTTHFILLSVRSKALTSVTFGLVSPPGDPGTPENTMPVPTLGDGVIVYSRDHTVSIASYEFKLVWRTLSSTLGQNIALFKDLALQGYNSCLQRMAAFGSRDRPSDYDHTEAQSWHVTRLNTAKCQLFEEVKEARERLGGDDSGAFGTVYKAVDKKTGNLFAIKVVKLEGDPLQIQTARAALHREVKNLERLNHPHIIEYLGCGAFETNAPEIRTPLREGSLASLTKSVESKQERRILANSVTEQILTALDYLNCENMIHRDIKPENILFMPLPDDKFFFQLADFGFAIHRSLAQTVCGTPYYMPPELLPHNQSNVSAPQTSKIDIWSFGATILAVLSKFKEFPPTSFPPGTVPAHVIFKAVRIQARGKTIVEPIMQMHPDERASAAQLLVTFYGSNGLVSKPSEVPPIMPTNPQLRRWPLRTKPSVPATETEPVVAAFPWAPLQQQQQQRQSPAAAGLRGNISPLAGMRQLRPRRTRVGAGLPLVVWPKKPAGGPPRTGNGQYNPFSPRQLPQKVRAKRDGVTKRRAEPPTAATKKGKTLAAAVRKEAAQTGGSKLWMPGAFPEDSLDP